MKAILGEFFLWLLKLVTVLIAALIFFSILLQLNTLLDESSEGGDKRFRVGVVELTGEITDTRSVIEKLYEFGNDKEIKGIVLRVDSPGGTVGPSQDVNATVREIRRKKPVVASFGSIAASGGLYAALNANKIFAEPGTLTGSIGAIMQTPNVAKLSEMLGFRMVTLKSAPLKDAGNPFREMLPNEAAYFERVLASVHADFVRAIAEGRKLPINEVQAFADGRILTGTQAKELKLIDDFGTVHTAARAVFDELGKPLGPDQVPSLVYPDERFRELKALLKGSLQILQWFSREPKLLYRLP